MQLIKDCDINKLRPWEGNPRKHDDDVDMLVVSITAHGFKDPIEVDRDYVILAGHGRTEAAKKMGLQRVPVIVHDVSVRDKKVQAYVLANNKTAERSEWDFPKLKDVFTEIDTGEFALEITGFDMGEIEDVMTWGVEPDEDEKADSVPSAPVEAVSKLGEMYQLGEHRLICGDCTQPDVVEKLMQGEKADICFTSPPYNAGKKMYGNKSEARYLSDDDNTSSVEYLGLITNSLLISLDNSDCVAFNIQSLSGNKIAVIDWLFAFKDFFKERVVWTKDNSQPAMAEKVLNSAFEDIYIFSKLNQSRSIPHASFRGTVKNTISGPSNGGQNKNSQLHSAAMPLYVADFFISDVFNLSKSVFEPFCGTGSTLIACEKTKRRCYGVELEPKYCDVIRKRWAEYTQGEGVDWQQLTPQVFKY